MSGGEVTAEGRRQRKSGELGESENKGWLRACWLMGTRGPTMRLHDGASCSGICHWRLIWDVNFYDPQVIISCPSL